MRRALIASLILASAPCLWSQDAAFQAGAAAVDITPAEFPLNMPGGFSANPATQAHDPLHARAIVLASGSTQVVLVVVDSLGTGPDVLNPIKQAASEATGIPTEHMLIASTHTHTGPSSNARENSPPPQLAYHKRFTEGVTAAIVQAHRNLQPAEVAHASAPLGDEVFNRRWFLKQGSMPPNPFGRLDKVKMNPGANNPELERPAGPTDPDITILSLRNHKRQPVGLLANYSLHYVGGSPKAQISADYFGEFARLMPSRLNASSEFVAMMSNGTSGDINNIPFQTTRPPREPFEQIRIVAQKAADTTWAAYRSIDAYHRTPKLAIINRPLTLKYRRPSPQEVAEAKAIASIKDKTQIEQLPRLAQDYARRTLSAAERTEKELTTQLQVIRIGDFAICGIPFETFVEIGLELKERSPFSQTMVIGLANGRHGYLPTPEHHAMGGYETWIGTNYVQEDASRIITEQLIDMLATLKKAD